MIATRLPKRSIRHWFTGLAMASIACVTGSVHGQAAPPVAPPTESATLANPAAQLAPIDNGKAFAETNVTNKPVVQLPVAGGHLPQKEIYRRALRTTALVLLFNDQGKIVGQGSAWVLDKERRLLITNHHVISAASSMKVYFPEYVNNRAITDAGHYVKSSHGVVAEPFLTDPKRDLAALKVDSIPDSADAAVLADESPSPGETMHSVGNPGTSNALWVYTTGTVRQVYKTKLNLKHGQFDATIIETQSPVNQGDSGGPVVDDQAKLVGVVSSGRVEAQLVSHFVDVSEVKAFTAKLTELYEPKTAEQFTERGQNYRELGRTDAAIRDFTSALKVNPSYSPALRLRGDCFLEQRDYQTALEDYNDSIAGDPSQLMAYTGRALVYRAQKKYDEALSDATKAIRLGADNPYPGYLRGLLHVDKRDSASAINDFSRALRLAPGNLKILQERARAYEMSGDLKAAGDDYVEAIKNNPNNLELYGRLGDLLHYRRKDAKTAIEVFSEGIKREPKYVYGYVGRGRAYLDLDQLELALRDLNTAVSLNPNVAACYDHRGDIFLARRDVDAALTDYAAALKLDSKRPVYHFDYAKALAVKGDHRAAIQSFSEAIGLAPDFADAYLRRALSSYQLGDVSRSQSDMQKARELNPEYKDLEVKRRTSRYLRITNATDEPVEVYVYYNTLSVGGENVWYPSVPGKAEPAVYQIEAGRTFFLVDKAYNLRVKGSKFRIWAKGAKSGSTITEYKDKDMVVVAPEGYVDVDYRVFDYTFTKNNAARN